MRTGSLRSPRRRLHITRRCHKWCAMVLGRRGECTQSMELRGPGMELVQQRSPINSTRTLSLAQTRFVAGSFNTFKSHVTGAVIPKSTIYFFHASDANISQTFTAMACANSDFIDIHTLAWYPKGTIMLEPRWSLQLFHILTASEF